MIYISGFGLLWRMKICQQKIEDTPSLNTMNNYIWFFTGMERNFEILLNVIFDPILVI